ncbi:MAG: hypothetical protein JXA19_04905 [Anaerolineales bacterium]|nr:hypothetical protein [Anaerolineales bacterium]
MAIAPTPLIKICDYPKIWLKDQEQWFEYIRETGKIDLNSYIFLENSNPPSGNNIILSRSNILLILTSGAYLPAWQKPFDGNRIMGDYSIRSLLTTTQQKKIAFSHACMEDYVGQAALSTSLRHHLINLEEKGIIGRLIPTVISCSGCLPNILRIEKELFPAILEIAQMEKADGVLFIPAFPLDTQTACLLARGLELNGIATTVITAFQNIADKSRPSRVMISDILERPYANEKGRDVIYESVLEKALCLMEDESNQVISL